MDRKPFRVFEAFSGIGAQSMALRTAGESGEPIPYEIVGTAEIDPRAIAAYDAINARDGWDPSRNIGDITHPGVKIPDCDILTYSFPCQALSLSGRLGGMSVGSGTTSSLVWSLLDQIHRVRPEWLVMENVPNIHSKRFMPEFQDWIDALGNVGYESKWADTNLTKFGLPQNRTRTIMISNLGSTCPPIPRGTDGHIPLRDILEPDVNLERYRVSEVVMKKLMYDGNSYGHRDFLRVINNTNLGYADAYEGDGVSLQYLTGKCRARGRVQKDRAPTLMTSGESVGVVVHDNDGFLTVRKFTPREAYRLQGFPDWAIDRIMGLGQSDAAMYRQAGNSLGVPMMREVFRTIYKT